MAMYSSQKQSDEGRKGRGDWQTIFDYLIEWGTQSQLLPGISKFGRTALVVRLCNCITPWRSHRLISYLRIFRYFVEPKSSLPCSQEPSTRPDPEPDESGPYHPILSLRSILLLSYKLRLGFPIGLFSSGFPTETLYAFLFSLCVIHGLPVLQAKL
jgi:hypothetical protein